MLHKSSFSHFPTYNLLNRHQSAAEMKENMTGKSLHNFDFIKIIGEGAWAQVYLGNYTKDGSQVAIKAIGKHKIKEVPKLEELVKTEIKVLRECKSENVIHFVDTFTSDRTIFIATEFCNGGDMEEYLFKKKTLTEDEATMFLKHILNGFKGLHVVGAMHRDFKLANILLHNGVAKIADLGFAKQMVKDLTRTILGTSLTMAPEVLEEKPYSNSADIWSIAVVYYQMIYGKYPYNGRSDGQILRKIKQNRPDFKGMRISENCRDFIDRCLTPDPRKRITWAQIYDHPLIKKNEKGINFLYGNDNTHLNENQNFYKQNTGKNEPKKFMLYPELSNEYDLGDVDFKEVHNIRQTINYDAVLKRAEQKKEMEEAFGRYSKQYFMKRNDIMFVFKYVAPFVPALTEIKANHELSMFIICKKAYIDMKDFCEFITHKKNYFKLNKFWEEFSVSPEYRNIDKQVQGDLDLVYNQCLGFSFEIQICSQRIEAEKDLKKVGPNFSEFVNETVDEYWFLLADGVDRLKGSKKETLIQVLQALEYFKGSSKTNVEEFERMMLYNDAEAAENTIRSKIQSLFG